MLKTNKSRKALSMERDFKVAAKARAAEIVDRVEKGKVVVSRGRLELYFLSFVRRYKCRRITLAEHYAGCSRKDREECQSS